MEKKHITVDRGLLDRDQKTKANVRRSQASLADKAIL